MKQQSSSSSSIKMKRSLHQDICIKIDHFSNCQVQGPHKKMKASTSSSDIAALTLLSLAFTPSKRRCDFQKPRLPNLQISSSQRRSSNPSLIPCDHQLDTLLVIPNEESLTNKPRNVIKHCTTFPKTINEPQSTIAHSDDWRKVFKPLPMPPRLPKLPAGAKATCRSFVVKKADLTQ